MSDRAPGARPSAPHASAEGGEELKTQRDVFVKTFFQKGAEFTEELLRENERLRAQMADLDRDNAALRTQLASDDTLRVALRKIEALERDKRELLSHIESETAVSTRHVAHHSQMETEIGHLANLYVALYQLHATLEFSRVVDRVRELLAQLIGARAYAIYAADEDSRELVPLAIEGLDPKATRALRLHDSVEPPPGVPAIVEKVFLTGTPFVAEGPLARAAAPVACVPMHMDGRTVGVIVVHSVFEQKEYFLPVDYELFKLLGAHAATALAGALLFTDAGGKLPSVAKFLPKDGVTR